MSITLNFFVHRGNFYSIPTKKYPPVLVRPSAGTPLLCSSFSVCALATILILTATRAGHLIDRLVQQEMQSAVASTRYRAILRFRNLWRFRSQFRMRLEDGAHAIIKVTPTIGTNSFSCGLSRFFHRVWNSYFPHLCSALPICKPSIHRGCLTRRHSFNKWP